MVKNVFFMHCSMIKEKSLRNAGKFIVHRGISVEIHNIHTHIQP